MKCCIDLCEMKDLDLGVTVNAVVGSKNILKRVFFLAVTVWYRRKLPLSCHATPSFPYQVVVRDVIKQRSARGESELTPVHV